MSEFKAPENVSGRYVNRRHSTNSGRGRNLKSGENAGRETHPYRSNYLRSRNNSGSSAEGESDNYHRNERYRAEGHLGSLRSPLRVGSQSEGRSGRWRELRRNDSRTRTQRSDVLRDRFQAESCGDKNRSRACQTGKSGPDRRGNNDEKWPKRENAAVRTRRSCSDMPAWKSDSVLDFPPLSESSGLDWGTRVEQEEIKEEVEHALNSSRLKCGLYDRSDSCASGSSESLSDRKTNFTPKRRFTETELATAEVQTLMARRQKQIDYGKKTACYENYLRVVPRQQRSRHHPSTPDKNVNYSRRGWDMIIKIWRKKLHAWDSESDVKQSTTEDDDEFYVLDDGAEMSEGDKGE